RFCEPTDPHRRSLIADASFEHHHVWNGDDWNDKSGRHLSWKQIPSGGRGHNPGEPPERHRSWCYRSTPLLPRRHLPELVGATHFCQQHQYRETDLRSLVMRIVPTTVTLMLATAAPVFAHAYLDHASPRVGNTVAQSPKEVMLWFTEKIEPAFSTIEVR